MATRATVFPNGIRSFPRDSRTEVLTDTDSPFTVTAVTDSAKTFIINNTSAFTVTLPALAANAADGDVYTFVKGTDDAAALILSPDSSDAIIYAGATVDEDLTLTAATAKRGDYVQLGAFAATTNWQVTDVQGIWAKP